MRLDDIRIVKEIHFEYEWNSKLCFAKIVYLRSFKFLRLFRCCLDEVGEDRQQGVVSVGDEAFRVELDSDNAFSIFLFNGFNHSILRYC